MCRMGRKSEAARTGKERWTYDNILTSKCPRVRVTLLRMASGHIWSCSQHLCESMMLRACACVRVIIGGAESSVRGVESTTHAKSTPHARPLSRQRRVDCQWDQWVASGRVSGKASMQGLPRWGECQHHGGQGVHTTYSSASLK